MQNAKVKVQNGSDHKEPKNTVRIEIKMQSEKYKSQNGGYHKEPRNIIGKSVVTAKKGKS